MPSLKKEYTLEGLDCASCAIKIEDRIKEVEGLDNITLNFVTKILKIEIDHGISEVAAASQIKTIVKDLEPEVIVEEVESKNQLKSKAQDIVEEKWYRKETTKLIVSGTLFLMASLFKFSFDIKLVLYIMSYLLSGGSVLLRAGKNIRRGQIFDENFLMSIATLGAFAIGEYPEAVGVMLFYQVGEIIQALAVNRSRKSIADLMDIRPDFANLKVGDNIREVSPEEVEIGDIIIVKPGERVPLDGKVIDGISMVDTTALTGESMPREINIGDDIVGGFININGLLTIEVEKEFGESTVAKILDLVENASNKKAPTENFITKFARYYTPVVVFLALGLALLPPLLIQGAVFSDWIYRALVFLTISCPCALIISIPLGFFGGIGGASRSGILIKGSNYLEALNNVDTVVFDKTGTLTKGVFKVNKINTSNDFTGEEVLEYAAYAEVFSNHPIGLSIINEYNKTINKEEITNFQEILGRGIKANIRDKEVLVGNSKLMDQESISYEAAKDFGSILYVAIDKVYAGAILIADQVKEDSAKAIKELKKMGIKRTVMFTGDRKEVADLVGKELDIDIIYSELLPNEKVEKLEELYKIVDKKLIFVGDGINDAPVLARADVGIAMGGLGSDAAIEAADVVLMTDEPLKIVSAIKIARRTRKIVMQNIVLALGIKAVFLVLGALGIATLWEAVFADVGVTLLAVLNSMRAMKVKDI